ncbi:MAG: PD-(D/E)XK nuclease domain-containing protein, partial [Succinivibrionaceae bacterium]|nr:PD-(D/E)XK nuclease domain-containing protein [Succinivibrionaceae bacterium]
GIDATEEDDTLLGSCDLKLEFIRRRIIIELKFAHTDAESKRKLKEACDQIIDRDYGNKPPIKELIRIALVYNDSQKKIEYIEEVKS